MSNLSNNSVETVNAAATAIVNAESRVQPTSVQVILFIFICFLVDYVCMWRFYMLYGIAG